MKIIIVTLGSMGDVLSFVALGIHLRQRGHEVLVLSHSWEEPLIRGAGLAFQSIVSFETGQKVLKHPDLFHPEKRLSILEQHFYFPTTQAVFAFIENQFEWGNTVVIAPPWAYGARIAQEKLGVPLLTVLLAPWHFHEGHRPTISPDHELYAQLNELRQGLGLVPISEPWVSWRVSPEKVVGLFPDWFGNQKDLPDSVVRTNFFVFDGAANGPLEAPVAAYLAQGERPLVFIPGTKMTPENTFFQEAVQACQQLKKRAIFLALFPPEGTNSLPETIQFFDYIPLSLLLPHAEALIYHGGIGTCSHGLRAALPHLVVPMIDDQFDNANRLEALGVGEQLRSDHYKGTLVAEKIEQLVSSPVLQKRCQHVAHWLKEENALGTICLMVEAMVR